ncbi:MAG TPA: biopolymer transporter ExbD [Sandaracinaceae bacterium LLY-WYZ-13_1]|nr:biopolymer transporter ExbD [Sandaracinaceae bacterium LLY-WYZ-13_1]
MGMEIEASSRSKKKGKTKPEMNVTPLVDVVLVLLIIFMVVMPAMQQFFWLYLPPRVEAQALQPDQSNEPIVVTVNERGGIQINRDEYPDDTFPVRLRRVLVARGERKIYFDAADNAPFERAVEAMDLARAAGAAHIAVMTERLR